MTDSTLDLEARMEDMHLSDAMRDFLRIAHATCGAENHAAAAHPDRPGFEQDDMVMAAMCRPTPCSPRKGSRP